MCKICKYFYYVHTLNVIIMKITLFISLDKIITFNILFQTKMFCT